MPNYQRYPSMTNQRGDLVRRVTNLENEQGLIARIAALEIAVAALTPKTAWTITAIKEDFSAGVPSTAGTAVMTPTGGVLTPAAGDGWANEGIVSAYLASMPLSHGCEMYVEVTLSDRSVVGDAWVQITLLATGPEMGRSGKPAAQGYCLTLFTSSSQAGFNQSMYDLLVYSGGSRESAFSAASSYGLPFTYPDRTPICVRLKVDNTTTPDTVSIKLWQIADPEPAAWSFSSQVLALDVQGPDGWGLEPLVPGRLQITAINQTGVPGSVTFANLTITPGWPA